MSDFTRATKWKKSKINDCSQSVIPASTNTPDALAKLFWKKLKKRSVDINELSCMLKERTEDFRRLCRRGGPMHDVIGFILRTNVTMADPESNAIIREK